MIEERGQNENTDPSFPEELRERYDQVRFLGKGGMGSVYFAHDVRLNRFVAIKLLPHTADNSASVVRFHQEARAISKLNNPHVVQVLDFGSTDNSDFFLVMEYIDGKDLEQTVNKNGPIDVRKAIDVAIQLCTALEHAHANGIVHRDLKPANIMIDQENRARILDFGVAKILNQADTDHRLTRPGQALGSILYMSPEQLRGEETDFRSDVYSLGLVIFKLVAGKLPNEDEKIMKIIRRRLEDAPPTLPPQAEDNVVVTRLNRVLSTALAMNALDRYESMTAFKGALEDCLSSYTPQQPISPRTKNAVQASAIVAAVCLLAVGLFLSFHNPAPSKKTLKKGSLQLKKIDAPPAVRPSAPREKSSQGTWLPEGFSEENDSGQIYWVAHDYVKNDDLKRLNNSDVTSLSLQDNQNITKDGIAIISKLRLTDLSLRDTKLGDECIDDINVMNLRSLNLRSTKFTESGILRLKPSPKLVSLDLKYVPIKKKGLDYLIESFPNLASLNIGETQIKNADLDNIKKLRKLSCLYLEGIGLKDKEFEKLARMDSIVRYEIADNPVTDASIDYLLKKPKLDWVSFGSCEFVSAKAIQRLRDRFPDGTFKLPAAEKPPDELKGIFLKEYE